MSKRKQWETKGGVRVEVRGRKRELRRGKREWMFYCVRVETGGNHGWVWKKNLREVAS